VNEAAARLSVTPARVRQRLAAMSLYGVNDSGRWHLPLFQFTPDGTIPGLREVLARLPRAAPLHPLAVQYFFTQPHVDLRDDDGRPQSPLIWLASGGSPSDVAELIAELGSTS
jgi:hypothetical protein